MGWNKPRDEEEKDEGLLNRLHLRLHHRILGDVERTSPEDEGEDDKDNERTEQRFECAESYKAYAEAGIERVKRHTLRLASNKQYGVEVSKKEKWTRGNDSLFIVVAPVCFYSYPHGPLLYLLLVT